MIDFVDINIRAQIAFGLMLIAGLLVYIAFFKDPASKHPDRRDRR